MNLMVEEGDPSHGMSAWNATEVAKVVNAQEALTPSWAWPNYQIS